MSAFRLHALTDPLCGLCQMILSMEQEYNFAQVGMKEIVANSLDSQALNVLIKFEMFDSGVGALVIADDGRGPIAEADANNINALPSLESFLDVIDLGHTVRLDDGRGIVKIGGFGIGLKKGVLGLGRDSVLATHNADKVFFALLSATLHEELKTNGVQVTQIPWLVYDKQTEQWEQSPGEVDYSEGFSAFDKYTAFQGASGREEMVKKVLERLPNKGGGFYIAVHKLKQGIDCVSVANDIKVPKKEWVRAGLVPVAQRS